LAANQPAISASTERQWQGIRRPNPDRAKDLVKDLVKDPHSVRGNRTRVPIRDPRSNGTRPAGMSRTRRRVTVREDCCPVRTRAFTESAITSARCGAGWSASAG
jgi:hypothetical protein